MVFEGGACSQVKMTSGSKGDEVAGEWVMLAMSLYARRSKRQRRHNGAARHEKTTKGTMMQRVCGRIAKIGLWREYHDTRKYTENHTGGRDWHG